MRMLWTKIAGYKNLFLSDKTDIMIKFLKRVSIPATIINFSRQKKNKENVYN